MAIPAAIVVLLLGILFFCSGLAVSIIQALCYVLIRPLSKSTYQRISRLVAELLLLELVWLIDCFMPLDGKLFLPYRFCMHYNSFLLSSLCGNARTIVKNVKSMHLSCATIDWLVGWVLAQGFVTAVSRRRSFVPAIYDVKVSIPKASSHPTMLRLFKGQSSVVHVHLNRHLMKDLPETAQWCRDAFVLHFYPDKHIAEGSFGE
ncbi:1-acyl-sn-glycerol-3-phosphate acyltransferase 2-like [Salvia hispanica]|uniref:1-acyl-sn-glycerol-3-phosphate acyltransferase 2-like n=1 Tax=Salvia hispanica TaxID=49212 RepID=UPI00200921E6|nr:1-acyl-sn-glycerol-3-phosphate acyltransferase 2-like [Salvia hispanica]